MNPDNSSLGTGSMVEELLVRLQMVTMEKEAELLRQLLKML